MMITAKEYGMLFLEPIMFERIGCFSSVSVISHWLVRDIMEITFWEQRLKRIKEQEYVVIKNAHSNYITACVVSNDDNMIVTGGHDGIIKIWKIIKNDELELMREIKCNHCVLMRIKCQSSIDLSSETVMSLFE